MLCDIHLLAGHRFRTFIIATTFLITCKILQTYAQKLRSLYQFLPLLTEWSTLSTKAICVSAPAPVLVAPLS